MLLFWQWQMIPFSGTLLTYYIIQVLLFSCEFYEQLGDLSEWAWQSDCVWNFSTFLLAQNIPIFYPFMLLGFVRLISLNGRRRSDILLRALFLKPNRLFSSGLFRPSLILLSFQNNCSIFRIRWMWIGGFSADVILNFLHELVDDLREWGADGLWLLRTVRLYHRTIENDIN